jgi:lipoyl(octanoyl) transferase
VADQEIAVTWLGQITYHEAWERQKAVVADLAAERIPEQLLLLEHPPVYTLGRSGRIENLLLDEAARAREGIELHHVDRGGDITYHGPGQLVGYPILHLKRRAAAQGRRYPDLHQYLRDLEAVLIHTLAGRGIAAYRYPGFTGVWVDGAAGPAKIAAIGVKISSRGISSHGFALNVAPNMAHFAGIVPCGIEEHGVASLAQTEGASVTVADLVNPVIDAFCHRFYVTPVVVSTPH